MAIPCSRTGLLTLRCSHSIIVGSLMACFIIRQKAKRKQAVEDAALGRESLDLELDVGPIYAQKPVGRNIPQYSPSPSPQPHQHRRQASKGRPGMHSRSTSVSLGFPTADGDPFKSTQDLTADNTNAQAFPPRGASKGKKEEDMGRGLLKDVEPMGRL